MVLKNVLIYICRDMAKRCGACRNVLDDKHSYYCTLYAVRVCSTPETANTCLILSDSM